MQLLTLKTWRFRNLADDDVVWDGGVSLVLGGNGQGKSNLLEAVTVLGTMRSFRSASPRRMVRHGEQSFLLEGRLRGEDGEVLLSQLVEAGPPVRRELRLNGGPVEVSAYLGVFPVVALAGSDRDLVEGPPAVRRSFLDRFCFHLDPQHLADLRTYQRCLRQRNAALVRSADDAELEAWELRLGAAAAPVHVRRQRGLDRLRLAFEDVYGRLRGQTFPSVEIAYRGESWMDGLGDRPTLAEIYRSRYNETRARDRLAGFTGEGPHRHDVALRADGRLGRDVLSSGQTKVVAAALRLAAMAEVEAHRRDLLPLIVDDMDAELDGETLARLFDEVARERQLLLSSAHERMVTGVVRAHQLIRVDSGRCSEGRPRGEQP